jgi:predicted aspartyl protease
MKPIILPIIVLLVWPLPGLAEYYKYRDENGVLRFSDTLPEKYAGQVEAYRESVTPTPPDSPLKKPHKTISPPLPQPQPDTASAEAETKFTLLENRILLPVEIVGTRGRAAVNLVMDTGAQLTFLWRTAIPSIGLRKVGRIRAAGITGSKYASSVRVKSLNIGPYKMRQAVVATMNPGRYNADYDGLLGMDFLMKVKYEIDYKRRVIIWKGIN